jgi:hypothetical protein
MQSVRHYGTPFNRDASVRELSRTMQKVKKRLDVPEEKPSVEEILKRYEPCDLCTTSDIIS